MKKAADLCGFALAASLVSVAPSTASSITFSGVDVGGGIGGPRVNADAAHALWLAAAGSVDATEDFEGFAVGSAGPLNLAGSMTLTTVGGPIGAGFDLNQVSNNQHNQIGYNTTAGGLNFFRFSPDFGGSATLTIAFGAPVDAFGVYVTGIESAFGTTTASWDGNNFGLPDTGAPSLGGVQFFGFVSDTPIASISFTTLANPGLRDIMGFDDAEISVAAVPEPATAVLVLGGLLGAAVRRRR